MYFNPIQGIIGNTFITMKSRLWFPETSLPGKVSINGKDQAVRI